MTGPAGQIFVKAASGELSVRSLRYELAVTRAINRHPPAVLWHFESDGWLVVGTEHLAGPHPDLSPGSADLNLLLAAVKALQEMPAPGETWFTPAARLGFAHPAMDGGTLIHSDLKNATKWAAKSRQNTERWVRDLAMWTGEWAYRRPTANSQPVSHSAGAPSREVGASQQALSGTANQVAQPGRSMAFRTENQPRRSQSAPNVSRTYRKARYR